MGPDKVLNEGIKSQAPLIPLCWRRDTSSLSLTIQAVNISLDNSARSSSLVLAACVVLVKSEAMDRQDLDRCMVRHLIFK